MEMIDRIIEQGQVFNQREMPGTIAKLRSEVESFGRRLDRLGKMETSIEEKYHKKLDNLIGQLNRAEVDQSELKILVKELKKDKETRSILDKKILDLENHKKIIRQTMKQVTGYRKNSDELIDKLKTEREALCLRIQDLTQLLDIAEQTELSEEELNTVCQRIYTRKELLAEIEIALRKRTIDLLFEGYISPRNKGRGC